MGDTRLLDMTLSILSDPFGSGHMGITAENIAEQQGYSRTQLDQFAAASQQKALTAINQGYFDDQIVPVAVKSERRELLLERDEHPRETSIEQLEKLKPAFKPDGIVTAGNASGLNDGAAALVMTTAEEADKRGLRPHCRLISYAFAGIEPRVMGLGPVPAAKKSTIHSGTEHSADGCD